MLSFVLLLWVPAINSDVFCVQNIYIGVLHHNRKGTLVFPIEHNSVYWYVVMSTKVQISVHVALITEIFCSLYNQNSKLLFLVGIKVKNRQFACIPTRNMVKLLTQSMYIYSHCGNKEIIFLYISDTCQPEKWNFVFLFNTKNVQYSCQLTQNWILVLFVTTKIGYQGSGVATKNKLVFLLNKKTFLCKNIVLQPLCEMMIWFAQTVLANNYLQVRDNYLREKLLDNQNSNFLRDSCKKMVIEIPAVQWISPDYALG